MMMDEDPTEGNAGEWIMSIIQEKRQDELTVMASSIIAYMEKKAEAFKLANAIIPAADYIKVYIDTIEVMSMMS